MSKKATILVVDDNELNMQMAADLLDLAGFGTLQAEDAAHGIELAKSKHPDLILMDMNMPVCDGYQATRLLKDDPATRPIPVVAFTAMAMAEEQQMAIESGCSGVICKPIDIGSFSETVGSYLEGGQSPEPAQAEATPLAPQVAASASATDLNPPSAMDNPPTRDLSRSSSIDPDGYVALDEYESFINRVSHDLQSPLRKLRQFSGFLKESARKELSPDNYQMLEALDRSANQMAALLSDLLELSRVGRKESPMTEFPLLAAVNEALQRNQAAIDEQQAEIKLGDMMVVEANYHQLVLLFSHLLENALKYSIPGQTSHIFIGCTPLLAEGALEITVQDNGMGFKPEYSQQIFEPLTRLHGVSQLGGTGVGLAIVKKIVDRHRGTIRVDSMPNQGATFTIRLPLRQNAADLSGRI
jgi:signal transduction histidine kinase